MKERSERPKINPSDRLIETIQRASSHMDMDEYARATGIQKEFIFKILKGEVEDVDTDTLKKLSLKH